eukprot:m.216509 g.216509  ORF g.216509 m.216509 type:complete len:702 (+) comp39870_c0_seq6:959-3064(+)
MDPKGWLRDRLSGIDALKRRHIAKCHFGSSVLSRADPVQLKKIFEKYASTKEGNRHYMTPKDFFQKFLGLHKEENFSQHSLGLLAGVVDQTKDGLISFDEFTSFESLLASPDALYRCAFQLFDKNANGVISFDEFQNVISSTEVEQRFPFDFNSQFIHLYFGKERKGSIRFQEFSEMIRDLQAERAKQAFVKSDVEKSGAISALSFRDVMKQTRSHLLSSYIDENLVTVGGGSTTQSHSVSYAYFTAFNGVLSNLDLLHEMMKTATSENVKKQITKEEVMGEARRFPQVTPLEVDIMFQLCDLERKTGRVSLEDFRRLLPHAPHTEIKVSSGAKNIERKDIGPMWQTVESIYRFALGSLAGSCGAATVYPIDFLKTRMQNQRKAHFVGEIAYKSYWDCFKKTVRYEGPLGLYRGILPQLIGVAPEKAIKLTMNDFVRQKLTSKNGSLPYYRECIAGGCAGCSQVLFTNPLEIVKIRMQTATEAGGQPASALKIILELRFTGLYKGASACLLRDIPFSAIYFPAYAHMKPVTADEDGYNSPFSLLVAAAVAGVPAAGLMTPADVIKTRIQVQAREKQTTYVGLRDAAVKIYREEGMRKFWVGTGARVLRSSPQFGVTLMVYELLQRLFDVDFGRGKFSELEAERRALLKAQNKGYMASVTNQDHIGGYSVAVPMFADVESKFGLKLPRVDPEVKVAQKEGSN